MDCPSCVTHVEQALDDGVGVADVTVNLVEQTVVVSGVTLDEADLADRLRRAGYPPRAVASSHAPDVDESPWSSNAARRTYVAAGSWLLAGAAQMLGGGPVLFAGWTWIVTPASILALVGAVFGGMNFVPSGLRSVRSLRLDINALMTVALVGAVVLGEFVEAAAIGALFSLAELLERRSMTRARDAIRGLVELAPPTALVRRNGQVGDPVVVEVDEVETGDTLIVRPGDLIALDGDIVAGESDVDVASLTGESMPDRKSVGDAVFAGTLSIDGYLEVVVTRTAGDTVLARTIELVRGAQGRKAKIERFVTRFARYYTPSVVLAAFLTAVVPPLLMAGGWETWVLRGLTLLVVSCPCALVISTPVSTVSAITSAARNGVVITGGEHLEALGAIRALAFDKTGTLTRGVVRVAEVRASVGRSPDDVVSIAAAIESHSAHPIAQAIIDEARSRGIDTSTHVVADVEQLPGRGIAATVDGVAHAVTVADGGPEADELRLGGATVVQIARAAGDAQHVVGLIALADEVRPEARDVIARLRGLGIRHVAMLTGDHAGVAANVSRELGIDDVRAGCLPEGKTSEIEQLRQRHGSVAMVGDGINDAPALAAASVGIAMGAAGSPTALDAADVALMADDLHALPYLVRLSRAARRVIRQNIWASLVIKGLMIVGVPFGFVSMTLAILVGDMGTSLAVTTNAMRLAAYRPDE